MIVVLIVVSITHQLKSITFDRFQLAVNNFFHVFGICHVKIYSVTHVFELKGVCHVRILNFFFRRSLLRSALLRKSVNEPLGLGLVLGLELELGLG